MRSYDVTAEFYDLLQATEFVGITERLLARWLGAPRVGVLDVGAGTGLATGLLARRCRVVVHAIEPAAPMRAILLSRLAGRADILGHVRVHARPVQQLGLARVADFALCLNTMASLDPEAQAEALAALATALVRGGTLVVQRPPAEPGPDRAELPAWSLGGDTYSGEVVCTQVAAERVAWRFTYRVSRGDALIREETETFDGYLATLEDFRARLASTGFTVTGTDDPEIMIARRVG